MAGSRYTCPMILNRTIAFLIIQVLEFHAYDSDSDSRDLGDHDFLGSASMTLGEIVSSSGGRLQRDVIIRGQKRGE